jgi:hypothetical protein
LEEYGNGTEKRGRSKEDEGRERLTIAGAAAENLHAGRIELMREKRSLAGQERSGTRVRDAIMSISDFPPRKLARQSGRALEVGLELGQISEP